METPSTPKAQDYSTQVSSAEAHLTERFNQPIHLTNIECLSAEERRNLLLRCQLDKPQDGLPTSVIIKQVLAGNSEHNQGEYNPQEITSWHTTRFMSDWVGAEFLTAVAGDAGHGPRFYGGDLQEGLIILEDLGSEHGSLVEPLLEGDAQGAETALLAFARRLGQMHADTAGEIERYRTVTDALHPQLMVTQRGEDEMRKGVNKLSDQLVALDIAIEPAFHEEVMSVVDAILDPGPFLAYTHRDPCPDNIIYQDGTLRLIDFEFGQMGHALLDITYGRMITPTCWCCNRIPMSVVESMESVYRTQLAKGCAQAEDDRLFEEALINACGYWLMNTLNWLLPDVQEKDWDWGIAKARPRILARLEAFIEIAEAVDKLPGYRSTAQRLHDNLVKQWLDVEPLPLYPAFR